MKKLTVFGQYVNTESVLHTLDPRIKIVSTLILIVGLLATHSFTSLALLTILSVTVCLCARISPLQALRSILPLIFIVVITAFLNLFYVKGGSVYLDWGWLQITHDGLVHGLFIAIRVTLILFVSSLLTMTTSSLDLTYGLEVLLVPLAKLKLPTHEFAFVLGLALRFVPQIYYEFTTISRAQEARGAKLKRAAGYSKSSSISSLVIPLFTSAFRRSETLSLAMEARCYHGQKNRTHLHCLKIQRNDVIALSIVLITTLISFFI